MEGVSYGGFADDLALWCTGREVGALREKMQRALQKVDEWAKENKIELNPNKCDSCLFTRDARERGMGLGLKLGGKVIQTKKELLYLGITVDQGLTFGTQVDKVVNKMKKRGRVLWAVAGKDWRWGREEMIQVYRAVVEACIWYGGSAWIPWLSESSLGKLERAQRKGLKAVTGRTKTTPRECFYLETGVVPVRVEARRRAVYFYEKACRAREGNPVRQLCDRRVQRRLRANKGWREQARVKSEAMELGCREERSWIRPEPWKGWTDMVELRDTMESEVRKGDSVEWKREVFRRTMEGKEEELIIYTDGSVEEGTQNGGAACFTEWKGEEIVRKKAAGKWSSSYCTETVALREGVKVIEEVKPKAATICTDSQAVIRRLQSKRVGGDWKLEELRRELREVVESTGTKVTIQWVPGMQGMQESRGMRRLTGRRRRRGRNSRRGC